MWPEPSTSVWVMGRASSLERRSFSSREIASLRYSGWPCSSWGCRDGHVRAVDRWSSPVLQRRPILSRRNADSYTGAKRGQRGFPTRNRGFGASHVAHAKHFGIRLKFNDGQERNQFSEIDCQFSILGLWRWRSRAGGYFGTLCLGNLLRPWTLLLVWRNPQTCWIGLDCLDGWYASTLGSEFGQGVALTLASDVCTQALHQ